MEKFLHDIKPSPAPFHKISGSLPRPSSVSGFAFSESGRKRRKWGEKVINYLETSK
jgi:hypothetical protein